MRSNRLNKIKIILVIYQFSPSARTDSGYRAPGEGTGEAGKDVERGHLGAAANTAEVSEST